jgi:Kef-type K+ transport system membrane component KefB
VQDIVVVLVMIGLTAFGDPAAQQGMAAQVGLVALTGVAFLGAIYVCMRWVLPPLLHRLAGQPELLVLFAITWAIGLAVAGDLLGFSEEVGAFLAGVSIASTPYREAIGGRLVALRDFLILFFFIQLGATLELGHAGELLVPAVVLSLFVLIGNPFIFMWIIARMGYGERTSFLTSVTVAQISEFSFIFAGVGMAAGLIGPEILSLITVVGLITIGISSYMILHNHELYAWTSRVGLLRPFRPPRRKEPRTGNSHSLRFRSSSTRVFPACWNSRKFPAPLSRSSPYWA